MSKQNPSGSIRCPLPHHEDKSPSAHIHKDHIFCYTCQQSIQLPGKKLKGRFIETEGFRVEHYQHVTKEREEIFQNIIHTSKIFEENTGLATRYLESRGLDPLSDVGDYGSIPLKVTSALIDLVNTNPFKVLSADYPDLRLDQYISMLRIKQFDDEETSGIIVESLIEQMNDLPVDKQRVLMELFRLQNLNEMRKKGLLMRYSGGTDRLGGRVILPTYWLQRRGDGYRLSQSNINARGIDVDGEKMYESNRPHHKAMVTRSTRKDSRGRRLRDVPAGIWAADPQMMQLSVKNEIIVTEGPLNNASLRRILPERKDEIISVIGTGYRQMIALLRWFGVKDDPLKSGLGKNTGIDTVYLARDFDRGGIEAFNRDVTRLKEHFPNLNVKGIHPLLPENITMSVPPYDISLFEKGGRLEGIKLDMNDLLLAPGVGEQYSFKSVVSHKNDEHLKLVLDYNKENNIRF